uniref:Paraneoplastic antigen Ma-like C-terminal domain-containing protein n=1 Tax=Neogobius melanostomus TaxID=47308 RepID=A0A8C6WFB9_9GOBI
MSYWEEASWKARTRWWDYVSELAWCRLGVPPEQLEEVCVDREVWASLLRLLPLSGGDTLGRVPLPYSTNMNDAPADIQAPPVGNQAINTMVMPWFMGVPWVPKFSGECDQVKFGEWVWQIEAMLRAQGLSDQQRADFVIGALEGSARREILLLESNLRTTAAQILFHLKDLYGKRTSLAQLRVNFFKCQQQEGESVGAFILRLRELFSRWRAEEPGGSAQDEITARDQLILGLRAGPIQQELQRLVRRDPDLTFPRVCNEARALEGDYAGSEQAWTSRVQTPIASTHKPNDMHDWKENLKLTYARKWVE